MFPVYAFQQHGQLRWRQVDFTVAGHRPHEATPLQPFGEQAQAVPVCPQHLYHVAPPSPEDEQMPTRNVFCTLEARPLTPLHMSVTPATSQMREPAGSDITGIGVFSQIS